MTLRNIFRTWYSHFLNWQFEPKMFIKCWFSISNQVDMALSRFKCWFSIFKSGLQGALVEGYSKCSSPLHCQLMYTWPHMQYSIIYSADINFITAVTFTKEKFYTDILNMKTKTFKQLERKIEYNVSLINLNNLILLFIINSMHHYQTRGATKYMLPKCRKERLRRSFFPSTSLAFSDH